MLYTNLKKRNLYFKYKKGYVFKKKKLINSAELINMLFPFILVDIYK